MDGVATGSIEEDRTGLPYDRPLEAPLHPKRRCLRNPVSPEITILPTQDHKASCEIQLAVTTNIIKDEVTGSPCDVSDEQLHSPVLAVVSTAPTEHRISTSRDTELDITSASPVRDLLPEIKEAVTDPSAKTTDISQEDVTSLANKVSLEEPHATRLHSPISAASSSSPKHLETLTTRKAQLGDSTDDVKHSPCAVPLKELQHAGRIDSSSSEASSSTSSSLSSSSDESSTSSEAQKETHPTTPVTDLPHEDEGTNPSIIATTTGFIEDGYDNPLENPVHASRLQSKFASEDSSSSSEDHDASTSRTTNQKYQTHDQSSSGQTKSHWTSQVIKDEPCINYGSEDSDWEDDNEKGKAFSDLTPLRRVDFCLNEIKEEEEDSFVVWDPKQDPSSIDLTDIPLAWKSQSLEPTDFFKFDWRALPNPPEPPSKRREQFSGTCGPICSFPTPYDTFTAIWNREIMDYIAAETNRYAEEVLAKLSQEGSLKPNSRISQWKNTDADELYVYFGLILATGMCVKTELKDYWIRDDVSSTPNFAKYMTQDRFFLLSKCLHFAPNPSHIQLLTRREAKIYKIEPIIKHLNTKFESLYQISRNIVIDESLTLWKGWLDVRQYIRHEAPSEGIKTFELCEVQTGYLWRFKVFGGQENAPEIDETPVSGVIASLVLDLLKGLEYKGHTVWMDHYYNSPALARVLKSLGFDCVGTLNTNRRFVPRAIQNLKKQDMLMGQVSSCTSGDVDVVVWRDVSRVALLSTYHGAAVHTENGRTKPIAIHDYNACMSGIHKKDQMLSTYPIERTRTLIWYKKLFRRLLNVSVLNAFIIYKHNAPPNKRGHLISHREFRRQLINAILERHRTRSTLDLSGATKNSNTARKPVPNVPVLTKEVLQHFPSEYGLVAGNKRERIRRSCVVCHKRVPTYCPTCNVPLCAFDCIKKYHS